MVTPRSVLEQRHVAMQWRGRWRRLDAALVADTTTGTRRTGPNAASAHTAASTTPVRNRTRRRCPAAPFTPSISTAETESPRRGGASRARRRSRRAHRDARQRAGDPRATGPRSAIASRARPAAARDESVGSEESEARCGPARTTSGCTGRPVADVLHGECVRDGPRPIAGGDGDCSVELEVHPENAVVDRIGIRRHRRVGNGRGTGHVVDGQRRHRVSGHRGTTPRRAAPRRDRCRVMCAAISDAPMPAASRASEPVPAVGRRGAPRLPNAFRGRGPGPHADIREECLDLDLGDRRRVARAARLRSSTSDRQCRFSRSRVAGVMTHEIQDRIVPRGRPPAPSRHRDEHPSRVRPRRPSIRTACRAGVTATSCATRQP